MHELVEVKTKTTKAEPPAPATITTRLELLREVSLIEKLQQPRDTGNLFPGALNEEEDCSENKNIEGHRTRPRRE